MNIGITSAPEASGKKPNSILVLLATNSELKWKNIYTDLVLRKVSFSGINNSAFRKFNWHTVQTQFHSSVDIG